MDALEKEISIDIAELRRDIRSFRRDLLANPTGKMENDMISNVLQEDQGKKGT